MNNKEIKRAEKLKQQLENCINYLDDEQSKYNGIIEPLNIFNIGRFINKQLYWTYEYISNYEYLTNSEILNQKIKELILIHTQFILNIIDDDLSAENIIKSVINELTNNQYEKEIKPLKKEQTK